MKICPNCGKTASSNEQMCPYCGKYYTEEVASYPHGATCKSCGNTYNTESEFCPYCGYREILPAGEKRSEIRKAPSKKGVVIITVLIVLVVLLAGAVVYLLIQNADEGYNNTSSGGQSSQKDDDEEKDSEETEEKDNEKDSEVTEDGEKDSEETEEADNKEGSGESEEPETPEDPEEPETPNESEEPAIPQRPQEPDLPEVYCLVVNCDDEITLRESPSITAGKITSIPLGETVEFIEESVNGFYKVKYNGEIGYCLSPYIRFEEQRTPEYHPLAQVVNCDEYITLRSTPSKNGKELEKIDLGEYVTYICNAENEFCCVEYSGQRGFVLKEFLEF